MLRLAAVLLLLPSLAPAASFDFEQALPAGAQATGDVTLSAEQHHSGAKALRLGKGGELTLPLTDHDGFGTASLWIYDSGLKLTGDQAKAYAYGPIWGLSNGADQRLAFGLIYAPYLGGNDSYSWVSTAEGGWNSRRYARSARTPGWHGWTFVVNNETDIVVSVDGQPATGFDVMVSRFLRGFSALYFRGSADLDEPLFVDDVQAEVQAEPLTARTRPLPGERRKPPDGPSLPLKPDLVGQHPRLFFTAADIAGIRARCQTTHADFAKRLLAGADSYLGQMPPANAEQCADDQLMQQWGWWRLQTLAFAYVVTGDERYARHAGEWMDLFCAYPDWGRGEEVNQSMGAANFLTGIACAYDWCYDQLTEAQRKTIREKLLQQVGEMCWTGFLDPNTAGYWKGDEQNNHRHHRFCGLTLAALAIDGEEPEAAGYATFAAVEGRKIAAAVPPDGSNHEGPTYTAYGFSYVVRGFDAIRHCLGEDLFAAAPGLLQVPWFRAYTLLPGFHRVFNFGDAGGDSNGAGAYYFNHYLFKLASEAHDPAAQALMKAAYDAEPDSYTYYPWPILWYDATLQPVPLDGIPTWRYFPDLELATWRSSWTDPRALAVLLKCGPYGGHRLNELRQGEQWVNVAHDHPDANHFMLFWHGQMWASDDGYPHQSKAGANHNLILVDGQGPLQRGEGWLQPIAGMASKGKLGPVTCQPGLFQARGDASGYYPMLTTAQRWLAVVDDQYVVVADHLAAGQPHRFDWLLHTGATVTPTGPLSWRLEKGGETLHLAFALPAGAGGKVTKDVLEGTERGSLLTVTPAQPASRQAFAAVFSAQPLAGLQAELGAGLITVHLPGRDVSLAL